MTDKDLLRECYDQLRIMFNPEVPLMQKLTARLAQPEPEPESCPTCEAVHSILDSDESQIIRNAKDGYPEGRTPRVLTLQDRVAALCTYASDWKRWCLKNEQLKQKPVVNQQLTTEQEPVAWLVDDEGLYFDEVEAIKFSCDTVKPLYTAPSQREWQGMTTDEIYTVWDHRTGAPVDFVRAIEAKLKAKNS